LVHRDVQREPAAGLPATRRGRHLAGLHPDDPRHGQVPEHGRTEVHRRCDLGRGHDPARNDAVEVAPRVWRGIQGPMQLTREGSVAMKRSIIVLTGLVLALSVAGAAVAGPPITGKTTLLNAPTSGQTLDVDATVHSNTPIVPYEFAIRNECGIAG